MGLFFPTYPLWGFEIGSVLGAANYHLWHRIYPLRAKLMQHVHVPPVMKHNTSFRFGSWKGPYNRVTIWTKLGLRLDIHNGHMLYIVLYHLNYLIESFIVIVQWQYTVKVVKAVKVHTICNINRGEHYNIALLVVIEIDLYIYIYNIVYHYISYHHHINTMTTYPVGSMLGPSMISPTGPHLSPKRHVRTNQTTKWWPHVIRFGRITDLRLMSCDLPLT